MKLLVPVDMRTHVVYHFKCDTLLFSRMRRKKILFSAFYSVFLTHKGEERPIGDLVPRHVPCQGVAAASIFLLQILIIYLKGGGRKGVEFSGLPTLLLGVEGPVGIYLVCSSSCHCLPALPPPLPTPQPTSLLMPGFLCLGLAQWIKAAHEQPGHGIQAEYSSYLYT